MSGGCSSPPLPWKKGASRPVLAIMKARVVSPSVNASREVRNRSADASVIRKLCSSCVELSSILLDQFGYQTGPASLVTCADPCSVVTMEIFVERNQIAPVRVILEFLTGAENWSSLIRVL